jgi:hypothetical protein
VGLRGGRIRALFIDLRRIDHKPDAIEQVLVDLLSPPGARWVVELRVRVRSDADLDRADAALAKLECVSALEQICASSSTRPRGRGSAHASVDPPHPRLWLTTLDGQLTPIRSPTLSDDEEAAQLRASAHEPMSAGLRVQIGRALGSGRELATVAALEHIARLGPSARVFASALRLLDLPWEPSQGLADDPPRPPGPAPT